MTTRRIAQLVSASVLHTEGRGFESLCAYCRLKAFQPGFLKEDCDEKDLDC